MTHQQPPQTPLYPLRFEPIYQYLHWGGRRLADLLSTPLLGGGLIGEAWASGDRDDHSSHAVNGPLTGRTIGELLKQSPEWGQIVRGTNLENGGEAKVENREGRARARLPGGLEPMRPDARIGS